MATDTHMQTGTDDPGDDLYMSGFMAREIFDALKKQMPIPPKHRPMHTGGTTMPICAECGAIMPFGSSYCPCCGQRWGV